MKKIKRIIPILLVLLLTLSMAPFASADNDGFIEIGKTGSITIHKFDSTGTATGLGDPGDGALVSDTTGYGNPLNGIVFNITLLPNATIDTTLEQAETMATTLNVTATGTTGSGTNADGEYIFGNLVQGIYLVEEVTNAAVTGTVEKFLVSIPMTDPSDRTSWLYDIHVYPKNTVEPVSLEKMIRTEDGDTSTASADIGETVNWVIGASIPVDISSIDITGTPPTGYFFIDDTLDDRLTYVSTSVTLVDSAGDIKGTFDGSSFTLTAPTTGSAGGYIKVDFDKEAGITMLTNALANGWKIEIVITTTINETAVENLGKAIANGSALSYKNNGGDPSNPDDPDIKIDPDDPNAPVVNLTGIALYKYWMDGTTKEFLNNAIFTIYESEDEAEEGSAIQISSSDWRKETGVSVVVGTVTVDGYIYFSQAELMSALGYDPTDADEIEEFETDHPSFWLVETTAPESYELLNEAIEVELGETVSRENKTLSSGFTLPITGGSGTMLFTIAGILLVGGAVTILLVSRKKKTDESK